MVQIQRHRQIVQPLIGKNRNAKTWRQRDVQPARNASEQPPIARPTIRLPASPPTNTSAPTPIAGKTISPRLTIFLAVTGMKGNHTRAQAHFLQEMAGSIVATSLAIVILGK